eukprot:m.454996 g.454996  ORF g.454996 m.454996 type:complete len:868 (-) comp20791_c0_seq1:374-2977(-)
MLPATTNTRGVGQSGSLIELRKVTEAHDREPARLRRHWLNPPQFSENDDESVRVMGYMLTSNECLISRVLTDQIKTNDQAANLVKLIDETGELDNFLLYTIRDELDKCGQAQMVFRRNSGRSRVISAFLKRFDVLGEILAPTVKEVVSMPPLDIDQNRQPGFGDAQIEGSAQGLEQLCGDLLQRMHDRVDEFPAVLKYLAKVLYDEAAVKFPACGQDVIITVFFLRYICPAIVTPWAFGVVDEALHPLHGRSLILLSKLLQMTCVMSGGDSEDRTKTFVRREECMACFREFVDRERGGIRAMCEKLTSATHTNPSPGASPRAAAGGAPATGGSGDNAMGESGHADTGPDGQAETDEDQDDTEGTLRTGESENEGETETVTHDEPATTAPRQLRRLPDEETSRPALWMCPTPRCRSLNFTSEPTCAKCEHTLEAVGEHYAADGITPAIKAARAVVQLCQKARQKVSEKLHYSGPTECTLQFSPEEILIGAAQDVTQSIEADYDELVMTEMYDVLESELLGGGAEVLTLGSILTNADLLQLDATLKATLEIALGRGLGGKLVKHVLDTAQLEVATTVLSPAATPLPGGEEERGGTTPVDHRPLSRQSAVSVISGTHVASGEPRAARLLLEYAIESSRAGVEHLVTTGLQTHLQGCRNFDSVNTMSPSCPDTQRIDAFLCQIIEAIFIDSDKTFQPLHYAAKTLEAHLPDTDADSASRMDNVRSFYGRAIIPIVHEAVAAQGSRTRGLPRIVKRALKHAFANATIDGSKLIGLCDGFRKLCRQIDTHILAASMSADEAAAAAAEHTGGVPTSRTPESWGAARKAALGVLAACCAGAVPSRPASRSDTIPYNSANHFKIALDAVLPRCDDA